MAEQGAQTPGGSVATARLDVLGDDRERLERFPSRLLVPDDDPVLQCIVREAAIGLASPIALVSLVLRRTQAFRAHHGLPPDLGLTKATDRDVSFCQLVVRDRAPLEVSDAVHDARVPQTLVRTHGIRAYLGYPLEAAGIVVGALCVIDLSPRHYSTDDHALLASLAQSANRRLAELIVAEPARELSLLQCASTPAFAELRNLLTPLLCGGELRELAIAELAPLAAMARHLQNGGGVEELPHPSLLAAAVDAVEDLRASTAEIREAARGIARTTLALERMLSSCDDVPLEVATADGDALAHHATKLVGGVKWTIAATGADLRVLPTRAITSIARCLAILATTIDERGLRDGIDAAVRMESGRATITFTVSLPHETCRAIASRLSRELDETTSDPLGFELGLASRDGGAGLRSPISKM